MQQHQINTNVGSTLPYPLISPRERLLVWQEARRILYGKGVYMGRELKKMRKASDRKLSALRVR